MFALAHTAGGAATLTEVCREVGINKSKGLAILNTLRSAGLVTRNDRSKNYRLGPGLLTLSRALLDQNDLSHVSAPYLAELVRATGGVALLGLISDDRFFVVARSEPPTGSGINIHVGHRFPLTWGAHGKAVLAALAEDERERILFEGPLYVAGDPGRHPVDLVALRTELEECRRVGYAQDLRVTRPDVAAVAAVVMDRSAGASEDARLVGCVVAVGVFAPDEVSGFGKLVSSTACEMSMHLASFW